MTTRSAEWVLLSVILTTTMVATVSISPDIVLAVKTVSSSGVATVHNTHSSLTPDTTTAHHIKGVKVLHVHTVLLYPRYHYQSKVVVGNTFGLQGSVFNNSTATITFANGTCTSPFSIAFNKNVITELQALIKMAGPPCKAQQVTLKHGEQSFILSPNFSGIVYKATAPGVTNATMTFKYEALVGTSTSPISDSISRVYMFTIHPAGSQTTISPISPHRPSPNPTSQHGGLRFIP
jgi:hypothetical protein